MILEFELELLVLEPAAPVEDTVLRLDLAPSSMGTSLNTGMYAVLPSLVSTRMVGRCL